MLPTPDFSGDPNGWVVAILGIGYAMWWGLLG